MEDVSDIPEARLSKINAAGLINLTLKDLWESFYKNLRRRDYTQANADLDCLWVEFGGDVEEGKNEDAAYNKVEDEVVKNFSEIPTLVGFDTYTKDDLVTLSKQYKLLVKKALFLKRLQNKQGKGTAYNDDSDEFMG